MVEHALAVALVRQPDATSTVDFIAKRNREHHAKSGHARRFKKGRDFPATNYSAREAPGGKAPRGGKKLALFGGGNEISPAEHNRVEFLTGHCRCLLAPERRPN